MKETSIQNSLNFGLISTEDMEPEIHIVHLGEPKAQQRHRHFTPKGAKFTTTYDPGKKDKASFLEIVQQSAPETPYDEPLRVDIDCYFSRPKSHYGTGRNAGVLKDWAPTYHTKKPDSDNICKFAFDALNKVFWRDDSVICINTTTKQYSTKPRIEIRIYKLNPIKS